MKLHPWDIIALIWLLIFCIDVSANVITMRTYLEYIWCHLALYLPLSYTDTLCYKNIQVKNIATIAKAALHKLLGKSSLNVRSVVDHDDSGNHDDHYGHDDHDDHDGHLDHADHLDHDAHCREDLSLQNV